VSVTNAAIDRVDMGLPAAFVWDYDARRPRLGRLYEKSKVSQWNAATDVDWSIEVDAGAVPEVAQFADVDWEGGPISTALGVRNDPAMMHEIVAQDHGWLISQFMHGEQGALVATAKICAAAESIDDKYYAAAQVADEARHVEAYQRYLDKIGITYPVSTPLHTLLDQVMGHRHVDMTFLGMQILVEGVALAAFSLGGAMLSNPLIANITELVRRDEARHVAFGVLSLSGRYDDMDPVDLAEREDFVLEACALMRYAGMSPNINSIGIYGFDSAHDKDDLTAKQIAHMIWYILDGRSRGRKEVELDQRDSFNEYHIAFAEVETTFLQSKKTGRWWMQLPDKNFIACSYKDYLLASSNEIPERWLRAQERN